MPTSGALDREEVGGEGGARVWGGASTENHAVDTGYSVPDTVARGTNVRTRKPHPQTRSLTFLSGSHTSVLPYSTTDYRLADSQVTTFQGRTRMGGVEGVEAGTGFRCPSKKAQRAQSPNEKRQHKGKHEFMIATYDLWSRPHSYYRPHGGTSQRMRSSGQLQPQVNCTNVVKISDVQEPDVWSRLCTTTARVHRKDVATYLSHSSPNCPGDTWGSGYLSPQRVPVARHGWISHPARRPSGSAVTGGRQAAPRVPSAGGDPPVSELHPITSVPVDMTFGLGLGFPSVSHMVRGRAGGQTFLPGDFRSRGLSVRFPSAGMNHPRTDSLSSRCLIMSNDV
ncbi:hypothetical protein Bbelb_269910 [Branchiostoma belcheri]|nr:hypothetical protein Bbelb_269910 [Branchiostoma belcheri]